MKALNTFKKFVAADKRVPLLQSLPKGGVCAEIGVYEGDFSELILKFVKPTLLYLVDPWLYFPDKLYEAAVYGGQAGSQLKMDKIHGRVINRFRPQITSGSVQVLRELSSTAATKLSEAIFDWIYIDANHQYEFVKKDLELFAPKVKPGGIILGDDYRLGGWWDGGVVRAVDEFAASGQWELTILPHHQYKLRRQTENS